MGEWQSQGAVPSHPGGRCRRGLGYEKAGDNYSDGWRTTINSCGETTMQPTDRRCTRRWLVVAVAGLVVLCWAFFCFSRGRRDRPSWRTI